jgi:radical SAM protein with 4Fe4S-binding SPASM domain
MVASFIKPLSETAINDFDFTPMKPLSEFNKKVQCQKISDFSDVHHDVNEYLGSQLGREFRTYRQKWNLAEKKMHVFNFPLFLVIETINACNLKCVMCFRSRMPRQKTKVMPLELYEKVLREASTYGCPSLSLNWNNEPLLDPYLLKRIALAKKYNILDSRINTNATLLAPSISEKLIDSKLTRLSVSIDAATPDTYDRIRKGGNYHKVISNIESFLKIREQKQARLPVLRCTFVRIRENEQELETFLNLWKGKADYVSIQSYMPHLADNDGQQIHPAKMTRKKNLYCSQPFERLVVDVNGTVYPCCSPLAHSDELIVGKASQTHLFDIWHGSQSRQLRNAMKEKNWPKIKTCRKCLSATYSSEKIS